MPAFRAQGVAEKECGSALRATVCAVYVNNHARCSDSKPTVEIFYATEAGAGAGTGSEACRRPLANAPAAPYRLGSGAPTVAVVVAGRSASEVALGWWKVTSLLHVLQVIGARKAAGVLRLIVHRRLYASLFDVTRVGAGICWWGGVKGGSWEETGRRIVVAMPRPSTF